MIKADLHTHSTASDGTLEPEQLVARAAQRGFTHLALTDHDSVEGIARAQEEAVRWGIVLIPGVEISCNAGREVHILGYGLDPYDEALLAFFRERTLEREERAARMVANLEKDGEKRIHVVDCGSPSTTKAPRRRRTGRRFPLPGCVSWRTA